MKIDENVINYIENKIEYVFKKKELLIQALTHVSYANEHNTKSYERLEYMGDSILNFAVARFLYSFHENAEEGELTKIRSRMVSKDALCTSFKNLNISEYVLFGKGQDISSNSKVYSDIFEALIAAIYFDSCSIEVASCFIRKFLISEAESSKNEDYKSKLQELLQQDPKNVLKYQVIKQSGTPNHPQFTVAVIINDRVISRGEGSSKKSAEQYGARAALKLLEKEKKN